MGVAMPGPYSSRSSLDDAQALANNLGISLETVRITETWETLRRSLRHLFEGRREDETEENMQARLRGTILMSLSNKFGALVLSTGNKSELAVGYCTLYGDMAGGLAVISDVPKVRVYELSRYVNSRRAVIPQSTITKPPSAELRPNQKDTDSLPDYEILDPILEDYIEDLKQPEQIAHERGVDPELVRRIVRMVNRSEYKRQQAAPGLKISSKAFGMGRRLPIAQRWEL
jgi:NAD+ synthetase